MKAIDTVYKGYRFRSRLEARWAVYLDAIGWEWDYEPEGFEFEDGTRYLPDFRVNCDEPFWIEVKAKPLTPDEKHKAKLLARGTGMPVLLAVGVPDAEQVTYGMGLVHCHEDELIEHGSGSICSYCKHKWNRIGFYMDGGQDLDSATIQACARAKQARFEFGESGARII